MKQQEEDMFQELFSWISNQEPWTLLELVPLVNSSDQTISSSVKPEPETTGLRVTTPKELSSLTQFLMLLEKKPKDVIASKDSKLLTPLVVEQDQVWEPSLSPKSEKNIQTESCKPSQLSHHQKSQIPLLNHIMLPSQSINWSKTLMNAWLLTTKPSTISVSELLNLPPQLMVIWTIWSLLPCQESLAASDSQVNLTLISEN